MYQSLMTVRETQIAIKEVKTFFEDQLAKRLELTRVSAPLFVRTVTGLNDNLNGVESQLSLIYYLPDEECRNSTFSSKVEENEFNKIWI